MIRVPEGLAKDLSIEANATIGLLLAPPMQLKLK